MAVNGIEIEVGQVWRTMGGEEVAIRSIDDHATYPVNAEYGRSEPRRIRSYSRTGVHDVHQPGGNRDLVELISPAPTKELPVQFAEHEDVVHPTAKTDYLLFDTEAVQAAVQAVFGSVESRANATQVGGTHYKTAAVQPWDYIVANGVGFLAGNVIKYVTRYKDKNGIEDLKKARHYLDKLIETEGGAQ